MNFPRTIFLFAAVVFASWPTSPYAADVGAQDDAISLERTLCFGTCPSYKITVFSNGDFVFEGYRHVKREGLYRGKFDQTVFRRATDALSRADYFAFARYYERISEGDENPCKEMWTDNASVHILVQRNGRSKVVHHYLGCRGFDREGELIALERELDEIFNTARWIK